MASPCRPERSNPTVRSGYNTLKYTSNIPPRSHQNMHQGHVITYTKIHIKIYAKPYIRYTEKSLEKLVIDRLARIRLEK